MCVGRSPAVVSINENMLPDAEANACCLHADDLSLLYRYDPLWVNIRSHGPTTAKGVPEINTNKCELIVFQTHFKIKCKREKRRRAACRPQPEQTSSEFKWYSSHSWVSMHSKWMDGSGEPTKNECKYSLRTKINNFAELCFDFINIYIFLLWLPASVDASSIRQLFIYS